MDGSFHFLLTGHFPVNFYTISLTGSFLGRTLSFSGCLSFAHCCQILSLECGLELEDFYVELLLMLGFPYVAYFVLSLFHLFYDLYKDICYHYPDCILYSKLYFFSDSFERASFWLQLPDMQCLEHFSVIPLPSLIPFYQISHCRFLQWLRVGYCNSLLSWNHSRSSSQVDELW